MTKLENFEKKYGIVNSVINGNLQYKKGDETFLDNLIQDKTFDLKLLKVLEFAIVAHGTQTRKDSDVPYWVHVATVGYRAYEKVNKEQAFCIGVLHDVVEDCIKETRTEISVIMKKL